MGKCSMVKRCSDLFLPSEQGDGPLCREEPDQLNEMVIAKAFSKL